MRPDVPTTIATVTSSDPSSPLDALLRIPAVLVNELGTVFPRFADRTRAQFAFAAAVAEKLRCNDLAAALSSVQAPAAERIADVVPFDTNRRAGAPRPIEFEDDDDEALIDVIVASVPPEGTAAAEGAAASAAKRPAAKAPAKKAPAKKAPATKAAATKAAATKASATKAPAKKAPAAKTTATKAPAKKAPAAKTAAPKTAATATKAPAKKAPTKKAPAAKKAPAPRKTSATKTPATTTSAAPADTNVVDLRSPQDNGAVTAANNAANSTTTTPAATVAVPVASALAIPNYDALAASQVVPRLASLSATDLDAVRRYEEANRGRRTILSGIAQIQDT